MTDEQKRASAAISFSALAMAVVAVVCLAYLAFNSDFTRIGLDQEPKLRMPWSAAIWFMKSATFVKATYGGLLTVIAVGSGISGELYKRSRAIIAMAVLCLIGILACTIILIQLADSETLKILRYYSDYEELAQLRSGVDTLFGSAIGWFTFFLCTQLGISLRAQGGAAKQLFSRLRAADGG